MDTETPSSGAQSNLLIPASIIVAGVMIAFAVLYAGGGFNKRPSDTVAGIGATTPKVDVSNIADDDPALGDPKAPVTIVEFSDFQCPFCGRFHKETEPKIIDNYVKTGKVRFVYRDFAFLGAESSDAAMAADCANEQGKFWEYHDYLFARQSGENQGAFARERLKEFAAALNLDTSRFNSCLDGEKYRSEVEKDMNDARALGVNATPTSFLNGSPVVGAVSFSELQPLIDKELAKKK